MPVSTICPQCGMTFTVRAYRLKRSKTLYCSLRCMGLGKTIARETKICAFCGDMFLIRPDNTQDTDRRFCSLTCHWRSHGANKTAQALETFWDNVQRCEHGWLCLYCCWPWQLSCNKQGYGRLTVEYTEYRAHRRAWELWHKQIMPGHLDAAHWCHFPPCCNPHHIHAATPRENMADSVRDNLHVYGNRHGKSKLQASDIPDIFRLHALGRSQGQIAADFNVTAPTINKVLQRQTWRQVIITTE
jgi:hypothetical protein